MKKTEVVCFGVLILNMNGRNWLSTLLPSLQRAGYRNKKLYLVDNGSTDGSQSFVRESFPEVNVLQMPRNLGYCMANNLASRIAFEDGCDWVIWQNNDTLVEPGWLDRMASISSQHPGIGVMGPVFLDWSSDAPNLFMISRHPDVVSYMHDPSHEPVDCDWVEGSACAVRRACFEDVGPLEPDLFIYWEEADFCRRAQFRGWRVAIVPGALARHYGGGDTSASPRPAAFNALKTHNFYVYKLCDPNRAFIQNLLSAARLWATFSKEALNSVSPMKQLWAEAKVFGRVLSRISRWFSKWRRDRAGQHPPSLQTGVDVNPDLIVTR